VGGGTAKWPLGRTRKWDDNVDIVLRVKGCEDQNLPHETLPMCPSQSQMNPIYNLTPDLPITLILSSHPRLPTGLFL